LTNAHVVIDRKTDASLTIQDENHTADGFIRLITSFNWLHIATNAWEDYYIQWWPSHCNIIITIAMCIDALLNGRNAVYPYHVMSYHSLAIDKTCLAITQSMFINNWPST